MRVHAALRPEFTADRLVVDATDPAYSAGSCRVPGCERVARGHGMCAGHHHRWAKAGRPEVEEFAATTDPGWARQRPNRACRVQECGYGSARKGLCQLHAQRWERSGRPGFEEWLATGPPPIKAPAADACQVPGCRLWPQAAGPFCHAHHNTWRANGRPDPMAFAHEFAVVRVPADQVIDLTRLPEPLRWELAYVIQCRHDERASRTPPEVIGRLVSFLLEAGVSTLREGDEKAWRQAHAASGRRDSNGRGLLVDAHQRVADLAAGSGWEAEYPRKVWQLRRLGHPGNLTLDFTRIDQPWLCELAKRWTRQRLATGVGLEAVRRGLTALTRLAGYLQQARIDGPQDLTRGVLEAYLADLSAGVPTAQRRQVHIGQLRGFLEAVRQRGWAPLDPTAALFTDDNPPRPQRGPRAVAEQVMVQLEAPTAIAAWPDPAGALITLILIRCGLRVGDATRLPHDCLVTDASGAPYLRYVNHKMNREALVPLDEELHALILAQQARVTAEATAPSVLFPRPTKNPDRAIALSTSTYRAALYRWLESLDVRDEHGRRVHLTPHQWRHTLGTRLINRDVPQEVVRRILDHDSSQMTAHYARLHDDTVRRHWDAARKVDITGATITSEPGSPLADAAWTGHRLAAATQALPNGHCALPIQKACPHANACLTCPMFLTTATHLPAHREHRVQVIELITRAEAQGRSRVAQMNQEVLINLEAIITALEHPEKDDES
ncbi:MAG: tyrosine-type recombinase/integrase [Streptomyces sp.]|nr:tyrosine-type recombinase/integrase [Streptomyces sp.]